MLIAGEKGGKGTSAAMYQIAPSWMPATETTDEATDEASEKTTDGAERSTLYERSTDKSAPESENESHGDALRSTVALLDVSPDIERESGDLGPILTEPLYALRTLYGERRA